MEILFVDKQGLMQESSKERAQSKLFAAMARFGDHVNKVELTVRDINGPRGGIDKECLILIKLRRMDDVAVAAKDESLSKAISSCIGRCERAVSRRIERRNYGDGRQRSKSSLPV